MNAHSPVIIIGMHRSGTGMVTRLLEQLGLFVGKRKDAHNEALFFSSLNAWLLRLCGGAWDHPQPIYDLLRNEHDRRQVVDYLRYLMKTPRAISFWGLTGYLRHRGPLNLDLPWGWKDPRNTFTLPIWLDLFPNAKVIHVYRHGVDAANSLKVRRDEVFERAAKRFQRFKPLFLLSARYSNFTKIMRCANLEGGFSLWEEYMSEANKHIRNLGERVMVVKYEDFLTYPCDLLRELGQFCGLDSSNETISGAAKSIKKDRAYAYLRSSSLREFAEHAKERLAKYGY